MNLEDPIQYLKGVGPKMAENFARLGIGEVKDLLSHYPRQYLNLSQPQNIRNIIPDEINVIQGKILSLQSTRAQRKPMTLTKAVLADETGQIEAIWFNQSFLDQTLKVGSAWIFFGKAERDFKRKLCLVSPQFERKPRFIAVYPETEGVTSKYLRMLIDQIFMEVKIEESLPKDLINQENLLSRPSALKQIHQPGSWVEIEKARERLGFEEMLSLALRLQKNRLDIEQTSGISIQIDESCLKTFARSLPFELTAGQKKAVWAIICDMAKKSPMNRLLNGDVGSGKTIVAAMAAYHTAKAGFQTVIMAPTEILANQHYQTFQKILQPLGISVNLRTSRVKDNKEGKEDKDVILGTHALIQENVTIPKLSLVVVDEQHRFGVKQREALIKRSGLALKPHFLSMTATPIPRTLTLSLYGDLDISVLKELPKGRQQIITQIISPNKRQVTYKFIEAEIEKGRQAYVICPLIDKSNSARDKLFDLEKKTVLEEYEKLDKEIFPHRRIGLLHGRLKSQDKEQVMSEFKAGKLDILVATSVVEVGIDVPNATVMMIESSESFGLATLWQFRGRVGRGEHQSYSFMFTGIWSTKVQERLQSVVQAKDGFELAEKDLSIRGPGELVGISQSGLPDFKMASLTNLDLINRTRLRAKEILEKDPKLSEYPELKKEITKLATKHLE